MEKKASIYVVQENEDEVRKITEPLQSCGYDVSGASCDGKKAIKEIFALKPDFLITELVCTGVDGLEIIRSVRKLHMQIIVVSNIESNEIIKTALNDGAMYFMAKPISTSAIISLIKELETDENDDPSAKNSKKIVDASQKKSSADARFIYDNLSLDEKISKIFLTIGIPPAYTRILLSS